MKRYLEIYQDGENAYYLSYDLDLNMVVMRSWNPPETLNHRIPTMEEIIRYRDWLLEHERFMSEDIVSRYITEQMNIMEW